MNAIPLPDGISDRRRVHVIRIADAMSPDPTRWMLIGVDCDEDKESYCVCGQRIAYRFTLKNRDTGGTIVIGSTCIEATVPWLVKMHATDLADAVKAEWRAIINEAARVRREAKGRLAYREILPEAIALDAWWSRAKQKTTRGAVPDYWSGRWDKSLREKLSGTSAQIASVIRRRIASFRERIPLLKRSLGLGVWIMPPVKPEGYTEEDLDLIAEADELRAEISEAERQFNKLLLLTLGAGDSSAHADIILHTIPANPRNLAKWIERARQLAVLINSEGMAVEVEKTRAALARTEEQYQEIKKYELVIVEVLGAPAGRLYAQLSATPPNPSEVASVQKRRADMQSLYAQVQVCQTLLDEALWAHEFRGRGAQRLRWQVSNRARDFRDVFAYVLSKEEAGLYNKVMMGPIPKKFESLSLWVQRVERLIELLNDPEVVAKFNAEQEAFRRMDSRFTILRNNAWMIEHLLGSEVMEDFKALSWPAPRRSLVEQNLKRREVVHALYEQYEAHRDEIDALWERRKKLEQEMLERMRYLRDLQVLSQSTSDLPVMSSLLRRDLERLAQGPVNRRLDTFEAWLVRVNALFVDEEFGVFAFRVDTIMRKHDGTKELERALEAVADNELLHFIAPEVCSNLLSLGLGHSTSEDIDERFDALRTAAYSLPSQTVVQQRVLELRRGRVSHECALSDRRHFVFEQERRRGQDNLTTSRGRVVYVVEGRNRRAMNVRPGDICCCTPGRYLVRSHRKEVQLVHVQRLMRPDELDQFVEDLLCLLQDVRKFF